MHVYEADKKTISKFDVVFGQNIENVPEKYVRLQQDTGEFAVLKVRQGFRLNDAVFVNPSVLIKAAAKEQVNWTNASFGAFYLYRLARDKGQLLTVIGLLTAFLIAAIDFGLKAGEQGIGIKASATWIGLAVAFSMVLKVLAVLIAAWKAVLEAQ